MNVYEYQFLVISSHLKTSFFSRDQLHQWLQFTVITEYTYVILNIILFFFTCCYYTYLRPKPTVLFPTQVIYAKLLKHQGRSVITSTFAYRHFSPVKLLDLKLRTGSLLKKATEIRQSNQNLKNYQCFTFQQLLKITVLVTDIVIYSSVQF